MARRRTGRTLGCSRASSDRFHRALLEFPLPTIAAVNGPAIAGGCDLATVCDLRIAATTAHLSHPEVAFGSVAYGLLHDLVGGTVARELCLVGWEVSAEEALSLHLVSAVAAEDALASEATARRLARCPTHLLRATKAKIISRSGNTVRGALDLWRSARAGGDLDGRREPHVTENAVRPCRRHHRRIVPDRNGRPWTSPRRRTPTSSSVDSRTASADSMHR